MQFFGQKTHKLWFSRLFVCYYENCTLNDCINIAAVCKTLSKLYYNSHSFTITITAYEIFIVYSYTFSLRCHRPTN